MVRGLEHVLTDKVYGMPVIRVIGQDEHVTYRYSENKVINRIGLNDLEFTDVKEVEVIITIPKRKKFSDKVDNNS